MLQYMPQVIGPWWAGTLDSDTRGVGVAATESFKQTFTSPEKLQAVTKIYQLPVLEYCRDAILKETVNTLSDERTVSADDAEATYARVVSTSLGVVAALLSSLPSDEMEKHADVYASVLGEGQVLSLGAHKDLMIRRALFRLLRTALEKQKGTWMAVTFH